MYGHIAHTWQHYVVIHFFHAYMPHRVFPILCLYRKPCICCFSITVTRNVDDPLLNIAYTWMR